LARSVVDNALRYRAQRPLVDALLKEIGLGDVADLSGMIAGEASARAASTPLVTEAEPGAGAVAARAPLPSPPAATAPSPGPPSTGVPTVSRTS
jgi:hypothetical protein